jgi:hypothetical protein
VALDRGWWDVRGRGAHRVGTSPPRAKANLCTAAYRLSHATVTLRDTVAQFDLAKHRDQQ